MAAEEGDLLDRVLTHGYAYRYDDRPLVGGPSPVVLACGTRGHGPVPSAIPGIVARLGVGLALAGPEPRLDLDAAVEDAVQRHAPVGVGQRDPGGQTGTHGGGIDTGIPVDSGVTGEGVDGQDEGLALAVVTGDARDELVDRAGTILVDEI